MPEPSDARSTGTFLFEVDGLEIGQFTEVSGLSVDVQVESLEEGGENQFVHKLPGRMNWPNITLKRGVIQADNLFAWLKDSSGEGYAKKGKLERRSAAITLLALDGSRLRAWNLADAFAVKWTGPSFAASASNGAATEELEIAHHGFQSDKP